MKRMTWMGWSLAIGALPVWGATSQPAQDAASEPATRPVTSFVEKLALGDLKQNSLWAWGGLLACIFTGLLLGRVAAWMLCAIGTRINKHGWVGYSHFLTDAASPASLAIFNCFLTIGLSSIAMSPPLEDFAARVELLLYSIAAFWYAYNLVSMVERALLRFSKHSRSPLDNQLVPIIRKTLRIFLSVLAVLFVMQNVFNRDIAAWLTGLGIAGLAVSLASQDSLKNLIGSITILLDRPFALGQTVRYHGYEGEVTEIGFRSTKIKTAEGSVVTIPNSNIVNDPVENVSARGNIRRMFTISIPHDLPADKAKDAVTLIRNLLERPEFYEPVHDPDRGSIKHAPRVYLTDIERDALTIKVFYWFRPLDNWEYMEYSERLNLAILQELEQAGIIPALPSVMQVTRAVPDAASKPKA